MNEQGRALVELFLEEATERLQFLREYAGIPQDPYPPPEVSEASILPLTPWPERRPPTASRFSM